MNTTPAELDSVAAVAGALGLTLGDRQCSALEQYLDMLCRWNATYNLTAVRDPAAMLGLHLADCLAIVPPLTARLAQGRISQVLDVGSGGGLPGAVLAVAEPGLEVTCLDAVAKKVAFVRQVAGALALPNLRARHGRVEALTGPVFDLVVSRAFASLAQFAAMSRHLLAPGGIWLAMKGRQPLDEIAALPSDIEVFHVEPLLVPGLQADRCLVWMRPLALRAIPQPPNPPAH
ncbi:MAG: 16S rRNA (guanine(527)-N(7))-methyltransferase RsmG [Burkholderiales bacterium]|nr:16S rRNA (guanine(527)-N(7))-methyltransferase RsmG [Burkholderiales bacterium]